MLLFMTIHFYFYNYVHKFFSEILDGDRNLQNQKRG